MKRVLIITYYWPPGGGSGVQRWLKMSGYLPEFGWEPHVLTVKNPEYQLKDQSLENETPQDIKVFREDAFDPNTFYNQWFGKSIGKANIGFTSGKKQSVLFKMVKWIRGNLFIPDSRVFWVNKAVKTAVRLHQQYDYAAMVTTGPPHSLHLAGKKIQMKTGVRWIADFRDPWTDIYYFNDLLPTSFTRNRHLKLESLVLKAADCIVVVGNTMKSMFSSRTDKPIYVIPNGYDHRDFEACSTKHEHVPDEFHIGYIGVMSPSQNPETLWRVLGEMVREDEKFASALRIDLTGSIDHSAIQSIQSNGLAQYLSINEYQPHQEAISRQIKADLLLLCINRVHNAAYLLTGKLFEYIGSGRPVLCIGPVPGDAADVLTETGSGITCDYENGESMRSEIMKLFQEHLNHEIYAPGDPNRLYSRQNQARQYSAVLNGKD